MPSISFRRFLSSSLALAFAIHTCRAHGATSPTTLTTTALDRSSSGWFAASACTATAEGHQTTRSGSSISRTAPHPAAWSSTSSLLQRSCSHPWRGTRTRRRHQQGPAKDRRRPVRRQQRRPHGSPKARPARRRAVPVQYLCSVTTWPAAVCRLPGGRRRARAGESTSGELGAGSQPCPAARTRKHQVQTRTTPSPSKRKRGGLMPRCSPRRRRLVRSDLGGREASRRWRQRLPSASVASVRVTIDAMTQRGAADHRCPLGPGRGTDQRDGS
jgi:hypothetical protein